MDISNILDVVTETLLCHASYRTYYRFLQVNKSFHTTLDQPHHWKRLYERDFHTYKGKTPKEDYKVKTMIVRWKNSTNENGALGKLIELARYGFTTEQILEEKGVACSLEWKRKTTPGYLFMRRLMTLLNTECRMDFQDMTRFLTKPENLGFQGIDYTFYVKSLFAYLAHGREEMCRLADNPEMAYETMKKLRDQYPGFTLFAVIWVNTNVKPHDFKVLIKARKAFEAFPLNDIVLRNI